MYINTRYHVSEVQGCDIQVIQIGAADQCPL